MVSFLLEAQKPYNSIVFCKERHTNQDSTLKTLLTKKTLYKSQVYGNFSYKTTN